MTSKKRGQQAALQACPCGRYGSQTLFESCCGRWLDGSAPDPESLMRSRYSAFVRGDSDYLLRTWASATRPEQLDLQEDPLPQWLGLEIKQAPPPQGDEGSVEFVARYKVGGRAFRLHEASRFLREGGQWLYVDGMCW